MKVVLSKDELSAILSRHFRSALGLGTTYALTDIELMNATGEATITMEDTSDKVPSPIVQPRAEFPYPSEQPPADPAAPAVISGAATG